MNLLRRCFECGQPLGKKDLFCPRCGAKQPREPKRAVLPFMVRQAHHERPVRPELVEGRRAR